MPPPRVLLVCTANICRSPAAQRLFAARVGPELDFFSRGVDALPGSGMCGVSGNWLATRNAFGAGAGSALAHVSTQLTANDVLSSTLVLTATENQRAKILSINPRAQASIYTLLEAARISRYAESRGVVPPERAGTIYRLNWLVETLWQNRASTPAAPPQKVESGLRANLLGRRTKPSVEDDSLLDPHEGAEHPAVLHVLERTVSAITRPLRF